MGSIRRGVIVMAKAPTPGQAKTRLCPPLTPDAAAALAEAFLRDTVQNAQQAGSEVIAAYAPETSADWFAEAFPGLARLPQRGVDLGARLTEVFEAAWRRRYQPCVVLGADSPDLPPETLRAAFDALRPGPSSHEVVLGPATDGGYYLLGLKWRQPELFRDIAWSTERVLAQTLERAATLGLRTHLLPEWSDVDTIADLQRLQERLADAPAAFCPHTRAALRAVTEQGG